MAKSGTYGLKNDSSPYIEALGMVASYAVVRWRSPFSPDVSGLKYPPDFHLCPSILPSVVPIMDFFMLIMAPAAASLCTAWKLSSRQASKSSWVMVKSSRYI